MGGIFLSYRRSDSTGWAGRLHDSLARELPGTRIFMDVEEIPPGVKFADYIHEAVGSCDVLIALIGPHWLDTRDAAGQRRLDNPDDFTRLEIVAALDRDVRVIPALVGGAAMPSPDDLPAALRGLCDRQNLEVDDRAWEDSCKRLCRSLRIGQATGAAPAGGPATASPPSATRRPGVAAWIGGLVAAGLLAGGIAAWAPWQRADAPAPSAAAVPSPGPTPRATASAEQADWDLIQTSSKPADFARYLVKHPAGAHAAQARSRAGPWITTREGCLVADPDPEPGLSHSWAGGCAFGLADGNGVLEQFKDGKSQGTPHALMREGVPVGPVRLVGPDFSYAGVLENGKPTGRGVVTLANGSRVEGSFVRGELVGRAVIVAADKGRYEGEVKGFQAHGMGTQTSAQEQYVGSSFNGRREGQGTLVLQSGLRYEGGFIAGKPSGAGVLTFANGNRLSGSFINGLPDGRLTLTSPSGQRAIKTYANGKEIPAR
ncbi:TIR domain-containing protein [Pseudaquabacterium pictum]|uniref:TIR domain-containing protein n=1 Tax=Pseudaquabacterium pictum TaxID=2315236 RepID=A0A480AQD6_9BURK|nr:TIR domain-containing protein [Rubrivivax pictus]GCL61895.1 hypothetical protein AQPW35_09760 [Rubrivivax pictus]